MHIVNMLSDQRGWRMCGRSEMIRLEIDGIGHSERRWCGDDGEYIEQLEDTLNFGRMRYTNHLMEWAAVCA